MFNSSRILSSYVAILFMATVIFFSCRKKDTPEPRICPDKQSYTKTDTMRVVSCSKYNTKQRWILPDGSPSTQSTVYFVPGVAGAYTFTLFVSSDDFVNEYKTTLILTAY